jgi:hypothetical protein
MRDSPAVHLNHLSGTIKARSVEPKVCGVPKDVKEYSQKSTARWILLLRFRGIKFAQLSIAF